MFQQENRSGWRRACSTLLACIVLTAPALRAQTPVQRVERRLTKVGSGGRVERFHSVCPSRN